MRDADVDRPNFALLANLYSANVSVSVVPAQDERGRSVSDGKSSDRRDGSRCELIMPFEAVPATSQCSPQSFAPHRA
jgi:hypothetical protein